MNYYEHHIGDYAAATAHLSWDEDMAYTRLLRAYYHHERGIPEGQEYRIARASTPSQKRAVDSVLVEFFVKEAGEWRQKRADEEVSRFQDKQRKATASAHARWSQTERKADAMRTHSEGNALQTPDTRQKKTPPPPKGGGVPGFNAFWNAYPSNDRKVAKRQCYEKWQRRSLESLSETIVAAVEAMKRSARWQEENGRFIPAPLVYLNQDRWEAPAEPTKAWHETQAGVRAKGVELGLGDWSEEQMLEDYSRTGKGIPYPVYRERVLAAAQRIAA